MPDPLDMTRLPMWVIYDHPTDYPDHYVARLHYSLPEPEVTDMVVLCYNLQPIREAMEIVGYICLMRHPDDDPKIIETWMV